ncbi:Cerato-platanin [Vararia minispora EC-137]|uniref:Cerato-platanin n=1 Tax=Vararia minispora EC-137 TaxID=1314806 RepID=A0ACB8Q930_9AGAM|nr:Cerato-platanin [Vararia minispora EC-137]
MKHLLHLAVLAPFAAAVDIRFDQTYDNAAGSTATVACSTGSTGLLTRGFPTFGSLPTFPNIGASDAIAGFGSAECGSCWNITFQGTSIVVTAIDHAGNGFNLALEAMNTLTHGNAVQFGTVTGATAVQLAESACGL